MDYLTTSDILERLRTQALAKSSEMDSEKFIVNSIVKIRAYFRPHQHDKPYSDTILVAQTTGAGSCYCYGEDPEMSLDILGADGRTVDTNSLCMNIAVLDSVYSNLRGTPAITYMLEGTSSQKSEGRTNIIVSEMQRVLKSKKRPKVTMVGSVGSVLHSLSAQGWEIFATDLDDSLIGNKLGNVLVEDGRSMTLARVEQSHVALITGMTLSTGTLADIIRVAKSHETTVIMFSETGGNFASELLQLGVECVIAEEYPFYMFPGITKVHVFRKAQRYPKETKS